MPIAKTINPFSKLICSSNPIQCQTWLPQTLLNLVNWSMDHITRTKNYQASYSHIPISYTSPPSAESIKFRRGHRSKLQYPVLIVVINILV